jgi:ribosomal protein S18 acetylase RimI-like enzyme
MPRVTDLSRIQALLDRDRAWAAYAIGDLSPEFAGHCEWHASEGEAPALVLLYQGFQPPILFAMGDPLDVMPLIREIRVPAVSLHVREDLLAAMAPESRPTHTRAMWRMALDPAAFRPARTDGVVLLGDADLAAVTSLYDDGRAHGEGPTFFHSSMLAQGTFYGVRDGAALSAVAGTHLFSAALGICTVGNVYTRRDRRRQGLGARVTSAVVRHAMARHVPTVVLNVGQENTGARRVYERLGFQIHCAFVEGEAVTGTVPVTGRGLRQGVTPKVARNARSSG